MESKQPKRKTSISESEAKESVEKIRELLAKQQLDETYQVELKTLKLYLKTLINEKNLDQETQQNIGTDGLRCLNELKEKLTQSKIPKQQVTATLCQTHFKNLTIYFQQYLPEPINLSSPSQQSSTQPPSLTINHMQVESNLVKGQSGGSINVGQSNATGMQVEKIDLIEQLHSHGNMNVNNNISGNITNSNFGYQRNQYFHQHLAPQEPQPLSKPWNAPTLVSYFIPRPGLQNQIEHYLTTKINEQQLKPIVLAYKGLGGVGKTQLALDYIYSHLDDYDQILWIRAGQTSEIEQTYLQLANQLGLQDRDHKQTRVNVINWLGRQRRCLLVFDDVESQGMVWPYLPNTGPQILITTRQQVWDLSVKPVEVGPFTLEEAKCYIRKVLTDDGRREDTRCQNETAMEELFELLGGLPLALAQACGYLREEREDVTIEGYIEQYKQNKQLYLEKTKLYHQQSDQTFSTLNNHELSVYLTWNITREKIAKIIPFAIKLLEFSAFVHSNDIPTSLYATYAELVEKQSRNNNSLSSQISWQTALKCVSNYSMLQYWPTQQRVAIHPLVQTVIRLQLTPEEKKNYKEFVADSLTKLHSPKNEKNEVEDPLKNIELKRLLSPHLIAVIDSKNLSLSNFSQKDIEDLKSFPKASWEKLSEQYEVLYNKIQQINEKNFTQQIVLFSNEELEYIQCALEQNHRKDLSIKIQELSEQQDMHELHTAIMLDQAAKNAMDLGDPKKALSLWMRALIIRKKYFGLNHPISIDIINHLGDAYFRYAQPWQAKEAWEFVFEAMQRYCSPDQIEMASLHQRLGLISLLLKVIPEAKFHLKKALKIFQKHYGPYSKETAGAIQNLGILYQTSGNLLAAKGLLKKAWAIYIKVYSARYPEIVSKIESLLDQYLSRQLDRRLHEHLLRAAWTVYAEHSGVIHLEVAKVIENLALFCDMKQAESLIEQALKMNIAIYGHNHPMTSSSKITLGRLRAALGDLSSGEKLCLEAYKTMERYYEPNNYILVSELLVLHHICLMKNDFTYSYLYASRAYAIICTHFNANHIEAKKIRGFLDKAKQNYIKASGSGFAISHFSFDEFVKLVNISETDWKKAQCYHEKLFHKIQQSKNSKTAYKTIQFSNEETKLIKKILESKNLKDLSMKLIFNLVDFSEQELDAHFLEQAEVRNKLAIHHHQSENCQDAVNFFKEALDFINLLTDKNQKILFEQATLQHNLGGAYLKLQENELASYYLHQALALVKELKKEEDDLFKKIQNKIKIVNENLMQKSVSINQQIDSQHQQVYGQLVKQEGRSMQEEQVKIERKEEEEKKESQSKLSSEPLQPKPSLNPQKDKVSGLLENKAYWYESDVLPKILAERRDQSKSLKPVPGQDFLCLGEAAQTFLVKSKPLTVGTFPCDRYPNQRFYVAIGEVTDVGNEKAKFQDNKGNVNKDISYGIDFLSLMGASDNVVYTVCETLLTHSKFFNWNVKLCQNVFFTECCTIHGLKESEIENMDLYKKLGLCQSIQEAQQVLLKAWRSHRVPTVFSEVLPLMVAKESSVRQARVILPLNIKNGHWISVEIVLFYDPEAQQLKVDVWQHDPYGGNGKAVDLKTYKEGKFEQQLKLVLLEEMKLLQIEMNQAKPIEMVFKESPYEPRQQDGSSCGAITIEDIVLLAQGKSLNNRLFPVGAPDVRQQHQRIYDQSMNQEERPMQEEQVNIEDKEKEEKEPTESLQLSGSLNLAGVDLGKDSDSEEVLKMEEKEVIEESKQQRREEHEKNRPTPKSKPQLQLQPSALKKGSYASIKNTLKGKFNKSNFGQENNIQMSGSTKSFQELAKDEKTNVFFSNDFFPRTSKTEIENEVIDEKATFDDSNFAIRNSKKFNITDEKKSVNNNLVLLTDEDFQKKKLEFLIQQTKNLINELRKIDSCTLDLDYYAQWINDDQPKTSLKLIYNDLTKEWNKLQESPEKKF